MLLFLFFLLHLLLLFLAPHLIPYLGFFPYADEITKFNLPQFLHPLANFDGIHYLLIATRGYAHYEQAFFPLYPFLIRLFSFLNPFLVALLLSSLSFFIASRFFPFSRRAFLFFLAFPASFFFLTVYTESLFFLLFSLTLYFLDKRRYFLVFIFSLLASFTRLIGLFLFIPILFHFLQKRPLRPAALITLAPFLGLGLYCLYLFHTTGDPLFFFHSQPAFGANRSTSLILFPQVIFRYLKIIFLAAPDFKYFIAVFELLTFLFFFTVLSLDLKKHLSSRNFLSPSFSLLLFSFAVLLLPTLTGTFSSLPRYVLFCPSVFIYLANLPRKAIQNLILLVFSLLHLLAFSFFIQGYFIS